MDTKGERIVGGTSNAQALIIGTTSPITYIVKNETHDNARNYLRERNLIKIL